MTTPRVNEIIARRLRALREGRDLTASELEKHLLLGEGWLELVESGRFTLTMDFVAAVLKQLDASFEELLGGIDPTELSGEMRRRLSVLETDDGVLLHFPYGDYDATYLLAGSHMDEFERFFEVFRAEVANAKSDAVATAFLAAVALWPRTNPADLWNFLIHQAYCDPLNHPPKEARRDFEQSWKRTGGWALERVLVKFYEPSLAKSGVHLEIPTGRRKATLVAQLETEARLEADKIDVFLVGDVGVQQVCFGAVHVKASFAERRTDDVPMSQALIGAGYISPLWTLDCKAMPSATPFNKGELGALLAEEKDPRSAKRKDVEVDGYFSACFSYNLNTKATPPEQDARALVYACDFTSPDDQFSQWLVQGWRAFVRTRNLE